MIKIPLILNPAAGRGQGGRALPELERFATEHGLKLEVSTTNASGDATKLAKEIVASGASLIAVAGGDGTIGEVAGAIMNTGTSLVILPVGTGNDLARHLGLPLQASVAAGALIGGETYEIDVGIANERPFVVAVGAGFDAAVARAVNEGFHRLTGSLAYGAAVVRTLSSYQPSRLDVKVDAECYSFEGYFAVAANCRGYGGGMKIAPEASVRDGELDVCCVRAIPRLRFLAAAGSVYRGRHVGHPAVRMLRGRQVTIESFPAVPVVIDGELCGETPVTVRISPRSLRLALPSGVRTPR